MKPKRRNPRCPAGTKGFQDNKTNIIPFTAKSRTGQGKSLPAEATRLSFAGAPINACEVRAAVAQHAAALNEPVPDKIFVLMDEIDYAYLHKVSEVLINERFQQHREPFAVVTADGKGCVISVPVEEEE